VFTLFRFPASRFFAPGQATYVVPARRQSVPPFAQRFGITTDAPRICERQSPILRVFFRRSGIDHSQILTRQRQWVENPRWSAATPTTPYCHLWAKVLQSIANSYGMTIEQVHAKLNNITNPDMIYRGQALTVWDNPLPVSIPAAQPRPLKSMFSAPIESAPVDAAQPHPRPSYTVLPGEHLAEIARRFNLDLGQHRPGPTTSPILIKIFAGQVLTIPGSSVISEFGYCERPQHSHFVI